MRKANFFDHASDVRRWLLIGHYRKPPVESSVLVGHSFSLALTFIELGLSSCDVMLSSEVSVLVDYSFLLVLIIGYLPGVARLNERSDSEQLAQGTLVENLVGFAYSTASPEAFVFCEHWVLSF